MDTLERKEKRLAFLRELYNIGIESVYKQMDRKNNNQTSESYILKFASEEVILSEQQLINECYKGTYTDSVKKILNNKLI